MRNPIISIVLGTILSSGLLWAQTPLTERAAIERALVSNFDLQIESLSPEIVTAEIGVEAVSYTHLTLPTKRIV